MPHHSVCHSQHAALCPFSHPRRRDGEALGQVCGPVGAKRMPIGTLARRLSPDHRVIVDPHRPDDRQLLAGRGEAGRDAVKFYGGR